MTNKTPQKELGSYHVRFSDESPIFTSGEIKEKEKFDWKSKSRIFWDMFLELIPFLFGILPVHILGISFLILTKIFSWILKRTFDILTFPFVLLGMFFNTILMRRKGLPNYWDLHFQSLMKSFEIWKIKREKKKLEKELKEKNPELYAVIFGMKNDIENLANKNLNKEKDSGKKSTRTTKRTKH